MEGLVGYQHEPRNVSAGEGRRVGFGVEEARCWRRTYHDRTKAYRSRSQDVRWSQQGEEGVRKVGGDRRAISRFSAA